MRMMISLTTLLASLFTGCNDTPTNPYDEGGTGTAPPPVSQTCLELGLPLLKGAYTADKHLTEPVYGIFGEVSFKSGTTLSIDAGVKVVGCSGSSYIAIDQGAKIMAVGTPSTPIIFTSLDDLNGLNTRGTEQGQWGGLSIFGYAETNKGVQLYEAGDHIFGCDTNGIGSPNGNTGALGIVCDDADDSGRLEYVIIKHSGYEVETDKELNGLSLGGVGSSTVIDHVEVMGSLDDGIECWGGSVDLNNIYLVNNADDSLDWDNGYRGVVTNIYVEQIEVDGSGSRGFETDNNGGSTTKELYTPISDPVVSQFTIVTVEAGGAGVLHREGSAGQMSEGVIVTKNPAKATVEVRSANTMTNGLNYNGNITLVQADGFYYAGHPESTNDSIYGDVTDAEVATLLNSATVTEILDTTTVPAGGADMTAFSGWVVTP